MNDDRIDRLVAEADPHDPSVVDGVRGGRDALLEEIVSTPPQVPGASVLRRRKPVATALVAAAAVAAAFVVPTLLDDVAPSPSDGTGRVQVVQGGGADDTVVFASQAIAVAQDNPRLLIDEPGWTVADVYGFAKDSGTINFEQGDRQVEMTWYPADAYDGYMADREEVSARTPISIDGQRGSRVSYSATDVAVMLEPAGPTFVEMRASGGFGSTADVLRMFSHVRHVSVDEWLGALPPEVVVPGRIAEAVRDVLGDVPLPPGLDEEAFAGFGVNDRYQFGAQAIQLVECGWLAEWSRADASSDLRAATSAVEALRSARDWDVLKEMDAEGDYSEGPWQVADEAKVGDDPVRYQEYLGCDLS